MITGVVKQQNLAPRLGIARQDIPGGDGQVIAALQDILLGHSAGSDDHEVRGKIFYIRDFGVCVKAEHDVARGTLRHPPVDDPDHLGATLGLGCQADLPTGLIGGLEDGDLMTALCGDARGLEPGGPGPDDHHPPRRGGGGDHVRHALLAPGGGVVDTERLAALIDPVKAIGRPDAGADIAFAPGHDLGHDMRVGHMGAGHADHIQLAAGHRMARRGHIGNARGVKGRQAHFGANAPREIKMRGRGHALHRDHIGEACVGIDPAADHVEEIDHAAIAQALADLDAVAACDAVGGKIIGRIAQPDDEIGAGALADCAQHIKAECHPRGQIAVVFPFKRVLAR